MFGHNIFGANAPTFFFFENEADGCERLEEMGVELEIKRGGSCVCVCVFLDAAIAVCFERVLVNTVYEVAHCFSWLELEIREGSINRKPRKR